jgi:hypothetical protein
VSTPPPWLRANSTGSIVTQAQTHTDESDETDREWETLLWNSCLYIASQTLANSTLPFTARHLPASGSIYSGPEGLRQTLCNVGSQAGFGAAAIAFAARGARAKTRGACL